MRRTTEPREVRRRENGAAKEASAPREGPAPRPEPERFPLFRLLAEDGGGAVAESPIADAELLALFRWMVLSRQVDERMVAMQRQGRIGFYIGAIGEEATVLGTTAGMQPGDWIFPCYREHAAALYRGMPLSALVCDMLGNADDRMLGHQMPCHEAWKPGHYTSISSPIGTQIPQAVGAAWAARIKGEEMVSLVYFGEGATSSNDFHTGLNFAGVHRVPTVFVCRNNGWAISVPRERQTASETIAQKAVAYGITGERVDGNDLLAVVAATRRARARAAAGEGPTLLECVTYRLEGHSTSDDPKAYRPVELVEPWRKKDPIARLRRHLTERGLLTEEGEKKLLAEVKEEILAAVKQAEAAEPKPPLETLIQGVYAEPLWQQREQLEEVRAAIALDPRVANPRHQG
jgi:2-oxoisovalerate dehydrogenase E1 component alpha subunit